MQLYKRKRLVYWIIRIVTIIIVVLNIVAYYHAYKFTHFSNTKSERTKSPDKLSSFEKYSTIFFGVNNPRPENHEVPRFFYRSIKLQSNKEIECWYIESKVYYKHDSALGTVILFHGYGGEKSSMLDKADAFLKLGYNTLLVDFMGCGGSEGNITTLGFKEAEEVKTAFDYISLSGEKNIFLFGTSMGAVAIMKSIYDYKIKPSGIIIECPFGSLYQTVRMRFKNMHIPSFPMAGLLTFWGGIQNGFWAFNLDPTEYAKSINCPVLLLYGEKDRNVSKQEIQEIYANIRMDKTLITYSLAGHENYLLKYKDNWIKDVHDFLTAN